MKKLFMWSLAILSLLVFPTEAKDPSTFKGVDSNGTAWELKEAKDVLVLTRKLKSGQVLQSKTKEILCNKVSRDGVTTTTMDLAIDGMYFLFYSITEEKNSFVMANNYVKMSSLDTSFNSNLSKSSGALCLFN